MKKLILIHFLIQMSIHEQIEYSQEKDEVDGVVRFGTNSTPKAADHALVFMIRFLSTGEKVPISYSFSSGGTNSVQLSRLITLHVEQLQNLGYHTVASISDQCKTNESAIAKLIEKSNRDRGKEGKLRRQQREKKLFCKTVIVNNYFTLL